ERALLQPALRARLPVQLRARIRRCQRDLHRVRIDLLREANRLLDRLPCLTRQPENERAVDRDAERAGVTRERPCAVEPDALADVVQDALVARLVADEQEAETVVAKDLQA